MKGRERSIAACVSLQLALGSVVLPCQAGAGEKALELRQVTATTEVIKSVAWNPDGTRIATSGDGRHVVVWDAKSVRQIRQLEESDWGIPGQQCVAFSADGRLLASGSKVVYVWDTSSWQQQLSLVGPDIQLGRPQPIGVL